MSDTICAISTPPGYGGIGIVRVSGEKTQSIATAILGKCPQARRATFSKFIDAHGEAIDIGIALFFPRPGSFTGEDVLELHGHGGVVVQEMICERVQELGARLANPGEFSERAFLNDRMDLAQAEAVADLINAATVQAARASTRSLSGRFSKEVRGIDKAVLELRMYVESAIDFADEEYDFSLRMARWREGELLIAAFGRADPPHSTRRVSREDRGSALQARRTLQIKPAQSRVE